MTCVCDNLVDRMSVGGWVCERINHTSGIHSGKYEFTAQLFDGIGHMRQMIVCGGVLWLAEERSIRPSDTCLAKKVLRSMDPFEVDNVFNGTEVRFAGTISHVEVTLGQTDSDATNVVGNVKLELVAHGSVERRKEQLAGWRVEDLVWEVAIWVDPLNAVAIALLASCMALNCVTTYATVFPSMATCTPRTT